MSDDPQPQDPPPQDPPRDDPPPSDDAADPAAPAAPDRPDRADAKSIVDRSSAGSSRERLASQHEARSSFGGATVHGNAAGRDVHIHNHGPQETRETTRFLRISDDLLEEIKHTFVPQENYAAATQVLDKGPIVFFQGAQSSGRYAAARHLLQNGAGPVLGLRSDPPLTALTPADLTRGAGYYLLDLTRTQARALDAPELGELIRVFTEAGARLVVTVAPTVRFEQGGTFDEVVVKLGRVPNRLEILERQLSWRLSDDAADAILGDEDVEKLIVAELDGDGPPGHARAIALELVKAYKNDLPLARSVAVYLQQSGEESFKEWFRSLKSRAVQITAVAIAVLAGEPYGIVSSAAELLRLRLQPQQTTQGSQDDLDRPLIDTEEWLEQLNAQIVPGTVRTRHGAEAPAEIVRFLNDDVQVKVLEHFFRAHSQDRHSLLLWLRQCASNEMEGVRFRAAAATGLLAAKSYEQVRVAVILPWATSPDPRQRETAAFALSFAASLTGMAEVVQTTLDGWAEEESARLRATSARAWQVPFEVGGSAAALEMLDKLGDDEDLLVAEAISDSLCELWEECGAEVEAPAMLLKWIADRNEHRKLTARLAFLVATVDLVEPVEMGRTTGWPKLLKLADEHPRRLDELARLWKDALAAPGLGRSAKAVLKQWAEDAESDPARGSALSRLLLATAALDKTTGVRLRHESVKWAKEAPVFAREFQQALARKVVP